MGNEDEFLFETRDLANLYEDSCAPAPKGSRISFKLLRRSKPSVSCSAHLSLSIMMRNLQAC